MPSENDSPHNVLGVSQTAALEEIQRYQEKTWNSNSPNVLWVREEISQLANKRSKISHKKELTQLDHGRHGYLLEDAYTVNRN